MDLDEVIERRGTHSAKWDMMEKLYNVPTRDGIAMWVADMDFRPPMAAVRALQTMMSHGVYGYYGDDAGYLDSICWWMQERHGWQVEPDWIFTSHGLVNGTALCIDAFSSPGDGVVLFTPVYHAFARVLKEANRQIVECPLEIRDGTYTFDFDAYDKQMSGGVKIAILCSPHNPGGRVWSAEELRAVADFCIRHDLLLISDEIHHDLVFSPNRHIPMTLAAPDIEDRLIMLTAVTKTFNLAGAHTGNVIIADTNLRQEFARRMMALGISPNSFGMFMAEAVYSPDGVSWLDEVMPYINRNRQLFDQQMNAINGVRSMPLEATYLAWVDFRNTGLSTDEVTKRVLHGARIAVNLGNTFGKGGEGFLRFNLATPRSLVVEALSRIERVFRTD